MKTFYSNFRAEFNKIRPVQIVILLILPLLVSCNDGKYEEKTEEKKMSLNDSIKRGEYLVKTIGCHDCHSPKRFGERGPEEIPELALSGFQQGDSLPPVNNEALKSGWMLMNGQLTAFAGPWGVSYSANLTSHETGLGNWTMDQFKMAMREGKLKGQKNGRMILPPMPWQNFANMTDEDMESMFKYLQNTEPINNAVPAPIPPNKLDSLKQA